MSYDTFLSIQLFGQLALESFEGTFPPSGWTHSGFAQTSTQNNTPGGTYSIHTVSSGQYIVTPQLTNPGILSFYHRKGTANVDYYIEHGSSPSGPWSLVTKAATGNGWSQTTYDLSSFTAPLYLRFANLSTHNDDFYIDDVSCASRTPSTQASNVNFSSIQKFQATVNWTVGNGTYSVVFLKATTQGTPGNPTNGTTYTPSSDWNSPGSQLGATGYYCIYNGTGNSVTVTNLAANTTYYAIVYTYNGLGALSVYLTNGATNNFTTLNPSITLSSPNPAVTAGTINQNSTNNILYTFSTAVTTAPAVLSQIAFTTAGTYSASDISNLKLWYNSSNSFSGASTLGTISSSLGPGAKSITGLSQTIASDATGYFWITTDLPSSATPAKTIYVEAITTGNLTFDAGSKTGTAYAGGTQTIAFLSLATDHYRTVSDGNWNSAAIWESSHDGVSWSAATLSPDNNANTITVVIGHTVSVTTGVTIDQTTVNGSLTINSGVTLTIANGSDTNDIVINGTLTNTGTVAFNASALMSAGASSTIIFNGSAAQTTGSGFPATVNNLTLNNSYTGSPDLTLSNNLTVNGTFTVTQGTLNLNGNTLSYGTSASLVYNGTAAQDSGSEWLSSMTRPVTISNTSSSGVTLTGNRFTSSSVTVSNGATITMGTNVISGSGSFTLSDGGTFVTANTGGVNSSITTSYSFSTAGNYKFNGTSAQVTGTNFPSTVNNFIVDNAAGVTWSGNITVNGNLTVAQGFFEMDDQYFNIPNNTTDIVAFTVVTSTPSLMPDKVNRQWSITGTWASGNITTRFYWDDVDDGNFDWSTYTPSVYKGTTEYTQTAYDLSGSRNWVEVSIPAADDLSKGTYTIGRSDEGTLPVELSSFTVAMNAYNMVTLMWVTQSETNVSGYRVYRNSEMNLESAEMLNIFVPATNTSQMQVYQVTDEEVYQDGVYYYWLENIDLDGASQLHGPISITVSLTNTSTPEIPVIQGISNAYPNPFNPRINLSCGMKRNGTANVLVYNTRGQLVKTIFSGVLDKGNFTLQWDGTDEFGRKQPSGVYLIRMDTASDKSVRKVVLSK